MAALKKIFKPKKPFECEFKNACTRSYSTAHSRRQHYRRHHKGDILPGRTIPCGMQKKSRKNSVNKFSNNADDIDFSNEKELVNKEKDMYIKKDD
eukprot:Pgem_evm1s6549